MKQSNFFDNAHLQQFVAAILKIYDDDRKREAKELMKSYIKARIDYFATENREGQPVCIFQSDDSNIRKSMISIYQTY